MFTAYCTACSFSSTSSTASLDATIHTQMTTHEVTVILGAIPLPRQRWRSTARTPTPPEEMKG